jgi:hypothetical protein
MHLGAVGPAGQFAQDRVAASVPPAWRASSIPVTRCCFAKVMSAAAGVP